MPGAHSQTATTRPDKAPGRRKGWLAAITLAGVAVVAVAATAVVVHENKNRAAASPTSVAAAAREVGVATRAAPFSVASVTPANGATQVPSDATISVQFSLALSAHSVTPTLTPAVAGTWEVVTPDTFEFVASGPLVPLSTETVTVPAGVTSATGKALSRPATTEFTVGQGSTLRLQQLLGQLGYLPVSFTPAGAVVAPQESAQPQQGTFAWRFAEPASLTSLWTVGTPNVITTGAIMNFESRHNLKTDGIAGPLVWSQLLAAAQAGAMDPASYNYVYVTKDLPETATVYDNGAAVYSTLANTGVQGATTADGTFPVYARYLTTTMTGTNPNGSHYSDPGIPWVSYFNGGDALHGFVRASYGYPQSDGCVEMPPDHAEVVFPYTPIGTLVTVS
jgi:peptidoglycan hydrolase-like protein with peptidoglycan-binding domain